MDNGLLAKVQDELDRLRVEKAHSEFMAHRSYIIDLAKEYNRQERIRRRTLVREFTRKQLLLGEQIVKRLEARRTLGDDGVVRS